MTSSARWFAVVACAVLLVSAGSATTYGYFVDTEQATGSVQAANSFNGNNGGGGNPGNGPPGNNAYNDANGNGQYDDGEGTYTADELTEFEDETANLVIPGDIDEVYDRNGEVTITANSIRSAVDIGSRNAEVELTATGGDIVIDGSSISSRNGEVTISTSGNVKAVGSTIESRNSEITISGENVDISDSDIYSRNEDITVTASSELTANRATIESRNGDISLNSNGDMYLDGASLTSTNGQATADLNVDSSDTTIHVDGISVNDRDGILTYTPSNVTEDPDSDAVSG
ncbi:hypothetical protein [Halosimplex sp. TS25]|uniref:hypothetical protein n=1 Tax=Halosimplex rarum TaxID=3396619 RepID=UPI0039E82AB2